MRTLFAYDSWANEVLLRAIEEQPPEAQQRDLGTSHRSLLGTMVHLVAAEEIWLSRWEGTPKGRLTTTEEVPDASTLRSFWTDVEERRNEFLSRLGEADLDRELEVSTAGGTSYRHRFQDMFRHLVNHSSYHRGQLVTLLRQLGAKAPATDLIRYYRENPG